MEAIAIPKEPTATLSIAASIDAMKRVMIQADPVLLERARNAARERGISFPQLVRDALEHELADRAPQPLPISLAAFDSGLGDLGARTAGDQDEPIPFR